MNLRRELDEERREFEALLKLSQSEQDAAMSEAESARATAINRMLRIRELKSRLLGATTALEVTPIPTTLEDLEAWSREHLSGRVEVTRRAARAARKSDFKDVAFVYRALLLLRDAYVPMRRGPSPEKLAAFRQGLDELGLDDQPTGYGTKYARETYSVMYGGFRRDLDRHLKGRNSRDRRFGFRLYYFYDDEEEVVVVGHLPEHLNNRET